MRFGTFGWAISRFTCASDSSPLMARIEWPKAMRIPRAPICFSHPVPPSQPSASSLKWSSKGGSVAPRIHSVTQHQVTITTTITVVTPMIFIALSLDSSMPRMFWCQK